MGKDDAVGCAPRAELGPAKAAADAVFAGGLGEMVVRAETVADGPPDGGIGCIGFENDDDATPVGPESDEGGC